MKHELYDKIYACWLGKNIGGTLGAPVEGKKEFMHLTFYPNLPETGCIPNDDLDLQLLNLHALEEYGVNLTADDIGKEWLEHVYFPFDEYGYAVTNLRYGLRPPYAGKYNNPFTNCMGCPIRSEIWACSAAGNPDLAVYFAWQDGVVDHAGGEGVYGEMFYAAMESMAFFSTDIDKLIKDSLKYIPKTSRTYKAVSDTYKWYKAGVSYEEIRGKILRKHGDANFTDAPQNIAFSMVGLLYGKNFEDGILKTANLGYDTDCTVATLGALYGIMYGRKFIPKKWSAPIGDKIVVSAAVRGFQAPADLDELTTRSIICLEKSKLSKFYDFKIKDATDVEYQKTTLPYGPNEANNVVVTLKYDGNPCIVEKGEKKVFATIKNNTFYRWVIDASLELPSGFACETELKGAELKPKDEITFTYAIKANGKIGLYNKFNLKIDRYNSDCIWTSYYVPFTILKASKWKVDGKNYFAEGNRVVFEGQKKIHKAETKLTIPRDFPTRLICASTEKLTVTLNGEKIIDCQQNVSFMPAFHRAPGIQTANLDNMKAGVYDICVELESEKENPMFIFLVLSTRNVKDPGAFFYLIDNEIGL